MTLRPPLASPAEGTALFAGDVTYDLYLRVPRLPEPDEKLITIDFLAGGGGVVANAAAACAVAGARSRALLRVGADAVGQMLVEELRTYGVDVLVEQQDGQTTMCVVVLEPHGEKRLILARGASMYPSLEQIERVDLREVSWIHSASYEAVAYRRLVERCRDEGIRYSVDLEPGTLGGDADVSEIVRQAELVFCNGRSATLLGDSPAPTLLAMGARSVVLTQGALGATLVAPSGTTHVKAPRGAIVDTTGAGDCLAGSMIARILRGDSPEMALEYAVLAATISCASPGSRVSYPAPELVAHGLPMEGMSR